MPTFSFEQDAHEPDAPAGEHTFVFERLGGDERREIPADTVPDAWKGLRYHEGEEWRAWRLCGYKDLLDREPPITLDQVAYHFALTHPDVVATWLDNDETE